MASSAASPWTMLAVWRITAASASAVIESRRQAVVNAEAAGPCQPSSPAVSCDTCRFRAVMVPMISGT
jgi:hypothetical protein